MKKSMKQLMSYLAVVAFIVAAGAALAFNSPSEMVLSDYYFEWDGSSIGNHMNDPEIECPEIDGSDCALGFDQQHVDTSVNPPVLKSYAASAPETYSNGALYKP